MIALKKKLIKSLANQFYSFELYDILDLYGKEIFEQFASTFQDAASKVKLNKRTVDHNFEYLFKQDVQRSNSNPRENTTYRPLHTFSSSLLGIMYSLYKEEIKRRDF